MDSTYIYIYIYMIFTFRTAIVAVVLTVLYSEVVFNESVGSDMCGYYEPDAIISV